jgi:hypothetical protein
MLTLGVVLAAVLGFTHPTGASATVPRTHHLHYQVVSTVNAQVSGPYLVITTPSLLTGGDFVDEQTGATGVAPPAPDCPSALTELAGGGDLLVDCGTQAEVFRLPAGPWVDVPLTSGCALARQTGGICVITGIGSDWLSDFNGCATCDQVASYESLSTGAELTQGEVSTKRSAPDLDTPGLIRSICPPIQAAPGAKVIFAGNYIVQTRKRRLVVQRCGRARSVIAATNASFVSARAHLVAWTTGPVTLNAACLPSGKHVLLSTPSGVTNVVGLSVAYNRLVITGERQNGTVRLYTSRWPQC